MKAVLAVLALGLASAGESAAQPSAVREQRVTVVFTVRIVPRATTPVVAPQINLRLPVDLPQQTMAELDLEGTPQRIVDRWNSPVLVYERKQLAPGEVLTGRWTASARVREWRWKLPPPTTETRAALTPEERSLCLRDATNFALTDPVIRAAAQQACAGRADERARLEGIFDLVMERMQYDRDGKWQPAPEALAAGKGSCSEYSYAFIALCRASGIPARYVGGIAGRAGVPFHVDTVFHQFPQAFVSGVGWVDFDPTRTDRSQNRRLYFGRTSPNMLLLCVGDGGEGSVTGWDYLESHRWAGGAAQAARLRTGWWFPEPPAKVRTAVAAFRERVAKTGADRPALVAEAVAVGHPFVLPWLDDLLYEPAARVDAAQAFLKIGGSGALRPVVESLGRLREREGDRRVGALLEAFTGAKRGSNRAKWQEWLKAQTASSPVPEATVENKP